MDNKKPSATPPPFWFRAAITIGATLVFLGGSFYFLRDVLPLVLQLSRLAPQEG